MTILTQEPWVIAPWNMQFGHLLWDLIQYQTPCGDEEKGTENVIVDLIVNVSNNKHPKEEYEVN